ncbi:MAG: SHOCT domain-containing protein [Candidatus Acidifodinimicrobium sp.]
MTYNRDPRSIFWYGLAVMFILIGIAAILSVLVNPHAYPTTFPGWMGVASGVAWGFVGLFIFLLFLWIIVWFFRAVRWTSRYSRWWDHDDALEILRERYAKGEISKEEYYKMREELRP